MLSRSWLMVVALIGVLRAFELQIDKKLVATVLAGVLMLVFGIAMVIIGGTVAQTTLAVGHMVTKQINATAPTNYDILGSLADAAQNSIAIVGLALTIAGLVVILLPFLSMVPWRSIFRGE